MTPLVTSSHLPSSLSSRRTRAWSIRSRPPPAVLGVPAGHAPEGVGLHSSLDSVRSSVYSASTPIISGETAMRKILAPGTLALVGVFFVCPRACLGAVAGPWGGIHSAGADPEPSAPQWRREIHPHPHGVGRRLEGINMSTGIARTEYRDQNADGVWDIRFQDVRAGDGDWEIKFSRFDGEAGVWMELAVDSDNNGVWDTWFEHTVPTESEYAIKRVDTDGDGLPDQTPR